MTTIIKADGTFDATLDNFRFQPLETEEATALDVPPDTNPATLPLEAAAYRIAFPTSHDGRGFSIARRLRERGFSGHLRAYGNVLADQFPLALNSGFDDAEISDDQAARMPQAQWVEAAGRKAQTYQDRLMRPTSHEAA